MSENAAFFQEMAARCVELAKQCRPDDADVAEELLAIARLLRECAVATGDDSDEPPNP